MDTASSIRRSPLSGQSIPEGSEQTPPPTVHSLLTCLGLPQRTGASHPKERSPQGCLPHQARIPSGRGLGPLPQMMEELKYPHQAEETLREGAKPPPPETEASHREEGPEPPPHTSHSMPFPTDWKPLQRGNWVTPKRLQSPREGGSEPPPRECPHPTLTNWQSPKGKKAGPPPSDHWLLGAHLPSPAGLPPRTHVKQILLGAVLRLQNVRGVQTLRVDV